MVLQLLTIWEIEGKTSLNFGWTHAKFLKIFNKIVTFRIIIPEIVTELYSYRIKEIIHFPFVVFLKLFMCKEWQSCVTLSDFYSQTGIQPLHE